MASYLGNNLTVINQNGFIANYSGNGLNNPYAVAADFSGNIWIANLKSSTLSGFNSLTTAPLSNPFESGGLNRPESIAIDVYNNVWITNSGQSAGGNSVSKFNAGMILSPAGGYTGGGLSGPNAIAIDGGGNAWITNSPSSPSAQGSSVSELTNNGFALSPSQTGFSGPGLTLRTI